MTRRTSVHASVWRDDVCVQFYAMPANVCVKFQSASAIYNYMAVLMYNVIFILQLLICYKICIMYM